jgi:putative ABC transport system ATP-binding protein
MPIIAADDLRKTFSYGDGQVEAVRGVTLEVNPGEFVALMGPSGSGKSTLLYILAGMDIPTSGRALFDGVDLATISHDARSVIRRNKLGVIFQAFNLIPTLTAEENVALPLELARVSAAEAHQRARSMLELVGMEHRCGHLPSALSGGEQQRVAIARALVIRPLAIVADEPTGNLDSVNSEQVIRLLRSLADERGQTLLMVTHDKQIASHADRVIWIRDGAIEREDKGVNLAMPPSSARS